MAYIEHGGARGKEDGGRTPRLRPHVPGKK